MESGGELQGQSPFPSLSASARAGLYAYCVTRAAEAVSLGGIGIEGREVYTVVHKELCAVLHSGATIPYQSQDAEVAATWVLAHHQVVQAAWERWGTVLPLTFNTIVGANDQRSADENLRAWLETQYETLKAKLAALAGKAEYGVQVFWDPTRVGSRIAEENPALRKLGEEIRSKPRGLAYMYRQKLEALLAREIEARAAEMSGELYSKISRCADNIRVDKVKKGEPYLQMLINLSCLVANERSADLTAELGDINNREGISARLVGPLPPYSFC